MSRLLYALTIEFTIPVGDENFTSPTLVKLVVYGILGREVATLVNEKQRPGKHSVEFDASGLASGIYYYQLRCGVNSISRKMSRIK